MKFELPADTAEFAAVVHKRAVALRGAADEKVYEGFDQLGLLDVLGPDSPDMDNKHLNTVVALEAVASAGLAGPFAETIWARAWSDDARSAGMFVGAPLGLRTTNRCLVLYGERCGRVLIARDERDVVLATLAAVEPADIKVQPDAAHAWVEVPADALSFEEAAPGYLWRANAALTVGYLETALAQATEYVKTRHQFGRSIGSYQATQLRLAECRWRLSGLQLLVREAAWRTDRDDPRSGPVSALAWLYARQVGRTVGAHVHQVFGAIGFTRELGLVDLIGAVAVLRVTVPPERAAQEVWRSRAEVGCSPPSTVLGGFIKA